MFICHILTSLSLLKSHNCLVFKPLELIRNYHDYTWCVSNMLQIHLIKETRNNFGIKREKKFQFPFLSKNNFTDTNLKKQ